MGGPVRQEVVLAMLAKEPSYGYELRARLRDALGPLGDAMNAGQIYVALTRLERAGLLAVERSADGADRSDRKVYALTPDGQQRVAEWIAEVSWPRPDLAEFHLKLIAAAAAGLADLMAAGVVIVVVVVGQTVLLGKNAGDCGLAGPLAASDPQGALQGGKGVPSHMSKRGVLVPQDQVLFFAGQTDYLRIDRRLLIPGADGLTPRLAIPAASADARRLATSHRQIRIPRGLSIVTRRSHLVPDVPAVTPVPCVKIGGGCPTTSLLLGSGRPSSGLTPGA